MAPGSGLRWRRCAELARLVTALAIPLGAGQIFAAARIHSKLAQWATADSALTALGREFPGFDSPATLLKVVTINALYGTNVYATARMARHVERVMTRKHALKGLALVESLAALPPLPDQRSRRHHSFASKFAHFFVDTESFPILDEFSRLRVAHHLGRGNVVRDDQQPYVAFVENFNRLKALARLRVTNRELDRYLWISGQYAAWRKHPAREMNVELRGLFTSPPRALVSCLARLDDSRVDELTRRLR